MSNPLFQQFGNQVMQSSEIGQFISEVKRMQQIIKNPQREVERMLQTGQMSQSDFNGYSQIANQIMPLIGGK